jgi:hypothetical protein
LLALPLADEDCFPYGYLAFASLPTVQLCRRDDDNFVIAHNVLTTVSLSGQNRIPVLKLDVIEVFRPQGVKTVNPSPLTIHPIMSIFLPKLVSFRTNNAFLCLLIMLRFFCINDKYKDPKTMSMVFFETRRKVDGRQEDPTCDGKSEKRGQ